ncbi:hypothetical protein ACS0TY_035225 [Phlomoides rotata]
MEGFEKGLFPSKSTASPKFTGFGENNENDSSQDKMNPQFQNHRKTVTKNFMSPTISAASKAATPRKKILGERKENLGIYDSQDHKMFNLNWKNSPHNSTRSDRFSYRNVSESEDDGDIKFSDDSSAKAYDPLKNYLSPRPKYLRFNPNRRRELVKRFEREVRDELNSYSESQVNDEQEFSSNEIDDSCLSPPRESAVEQESVEKVEEDNVDVNQEEEEEEDDEDEEEEKGWCLGGVFKIVLTLIACLLSTSYICSMNSPTPSPTQQAIWNLRDGYLMIQRQTLEFVNMKMHNAGVFEVEVGDVYSEVEDAVIDEDDGGIEESVEAAITEDDVESLERHENDDNIDYIAKDADFFEFKQAANTDETETTMYADSLKEEDNSNKIAASESEILGGGGVESETHNSVLLMDAKSEESGDAGGSVLVMDIEGPNQLQEIELSMKYVPEETSKESKILGGRDSLDVVIGFQEVDEMEGSNQSESVPEETPKLEELVPSHEKFSDEIGYGDEVEMKKKEGWNTSSAAIGIFAAASLFSTLLAVVYHSKKARSLPPRESKSVLKPHKYALEEKVVDRKVEFLARPSSPPHSTEEARKEFSHRLYAPSVELIGEIVVGSRRSYAKYDTELEESNATYDHTSLPHPFSTPTKQQSVTTSSPSYGGSFTNEKRKILQKEVGDATPAATPVRRSNRLRNRAAVITSPN